MSAAEKNTMAAPAQEILSSYIKKLGHPIKEIRERALQLLKAKIELGWEFNDELARVRELLEALLSWFDVSDSSLHKDALYLLLTIVKTETGVYIVREFGVAKIIQRLNKNKCNIDKDAMEIFDDIIETLQFLNTVESDENISVPPLALGSLKSTDNEESFESCKLFANPTSTDETSSTEEVVIKKQTIRESPGNDGITVLLLPWVNLCTADSKTMNLVEDALKIVKSTKRCCRFIRDVFLRDFPVEILLNRPKMIHCLLKILDSETSGQYGEALHVLLCVTQAARERLRQLACLELVNNVAKDTSEKFNEEDRINVALEDIAGVEENLSPDDQLAALRQMPVPIYALDTLRTVLTFISRNMRNEHFCESLRLRELNICSDLVDSLTELLLECVSASFWCVEHISNTSRDIAQKSFMVMRSLGELLVLCRKSYGENPAFPNYRALWLRLLSCSERLLNWLRDSGMQPSSLIRALQYAQLDPAVEILYPTLSKRIALTLEIVGMDVDHKNKFADMTKLIASMEDAVRFMKNKDSCRNSKKVYTIIKKSLPSLEFHMNETFLDEVIEMLVDKTEDFVLEDDDWSVIRSIALSLMAHNLVSVREKFYDKLLHLVKTVISGNENLQAVNEKRLTLICDVGMFTEICCHGISAESETISRRATEVILYLLRGRLALTGSCWWRVLSSLLPVFPLLHVYAAHDTDLGTAICKSLETDIAECMGVPLTEVTMGWVRLLFVTCPAVNLDAAFALCRLMDDEKFLPLREALRADVLMHALNRVETEDFNINSTSSPSSHPQTSNLIQVLEVLKQDLVLDEYGSGDTAMSGCRPTLEPSLRRSTLQQLAVLMQQQELHDTFLQHDGLKIVISILRMSMIVDDYYAFPECAISCVSVLNNVCFACRHNLARIPGLVILLLRVILVFPSNQSVVQMCAQCLALLAWSGFALQELNASRRRVPALPHCVTARTKLPFVVDSYWKTSPNTKSSSVEWLVLEEEYRAFLRVQWWMQYAGKQGFLDSRLPPAPHSLQPTAADRAALQHASPIFIATKALLDLENASSHQSVNEALNLLVSFTHLVGRSSLDSRDYAALPWRNMSRFLTTQPASSRDTALLIAMLQFILVYMESVPSDNGTISWIIPSFIGNDATIISLLGKSDIYPQQTSQDQVEIIQLQIYIVKVVLRCVMTLEWSEDYSEKQLESLVKILLACLERVDLKNFHMLGFLNELVRCIRYALNSRYCKLSEGTMLQCLNVMTWTLRGCASGSGCKGQACRLDAMIALLALLKHINDIFIPVQRWSDYWSSEVVSAVAESARGSSAELRAAALYVMNALAQHVLFMPLLLKALQEESLCDYACSIFCDLNEANVVRTAAACLLSSITARVSPHSEVLQCDVLNQFNGHGVLEVFVEILITFFNESQFRSHIEPNVPVSLLERRNELEVRAKKCGDVHIIPVVHANVRPPPAMRMAAAVADVLHNLNQFPRWPVQEWNERGIYRLLFRCASWSHGQLSEVYYVRAASCRALFETTLHKCVRTTLATTKDCLYNLITTVKPIEEEVCSAECVSAQTQTFLLLGSLMSERAATDTVWEALRKKVAVPFFQAILQALGSKQAELQEAGLFCLAKLSQSVMQKRHPDKQIDESRAQLFDKLKSPLEIQGEDIKKEISESAKDCVPEYMVEEICKALLMLFERLAEEGDFIGQEGSWSRVCSCLSSVLSGSERARAYCVHKQLPRALVATLRTIRDKRALMPDDTNIRNANNNPTLRTLYWLLTVTNCLMLNCLPAKEAVADEDIALSLNRLWPWCILTEQLREAIIRLLLTFCNDCPKAWGCMSMCVASRSLAWEVCGVATREAAHQSHARPETLLLLCLRLIVIIMPHHHCRAIIIKSDVLNGVFRTRVREREGGGGAAGLWWARAWGAAARHPDGAAAALALRPLPAARHLRPLLLPALAYFATHRRAHLLNAGDLLELICAALLTGDVGEMVSATRAVWTLAANSHKAKLMLRSAGVTSAVQSAVQRVQRYQKDEAAQRALQLLIYVNTLLQGV